MTDTLTSYRLITKDLTASLKRKGAEPAIARETKYYEENIGKVKSVDDLLGDSRLFTYAMKAYGLEEMTYAKAFMRKVLEGGVSSTTSFANRLSDDRYVAFAKAFNFNLAVTATGTDVKNTYGEATFGTPGTAASLTASTALASSYDFSGTNESSFEISSQISPGVTRSLTIVLNAKTLASSVANLKKVTPQEIRLAVAAQVEASGSDGLADKIKVGLSTKGNFYFETTADTDLGLDGVAGGTGKNADTVVYAGGTVRTLAIRNMPTSSESQTAVDVGFGTSLGPDASADAVTQAYLRETLESDIGDTDTGVRLALYFARKAPSLTTAYQILGDTALTKVANTMIGLPATSSSTTSEALARRAAKITEKIDFASFKDADKLDAFVRRFAVIWDAQNNTDSAPVLALFNSGSSDVDTLMSIQASQSTL